MLNTFKFQFAQLLSQYLPLSSDQIVEMVVLAPENVAGDLAFPCFQLAKTLGKAPHLIAQDFKTQVEGQDLGVFSEIFAVGPYINASFAPQKLAQTVLSQIKNQKSDYGSGNAQEKTILLE